MKLITCLSDEQLSILQDTGEYFCDGENGSCGVPSSFLNQIAMQNRLFKDITNPIVCYRESSTPLNITESNVVTLDAPDEFTHVVSNESYSVRTTSRLVNINVPPLFGTGNTPNQTESVFNAQGNQTTVMLPYLLESWLEDTYKKDELPTNVYVNDIIDGNITLLKS